MKNPGYIVETKSGLIGRTYNSKEMINCKIPVYLCEEFSEKEIEGMKIPLRFSEKAILCDPDSLKMKGFID